MDSILAFRNKIALGVMSALVMHHRTLLNFFKAISSGRLREMSVDMGARTSRRKPKPPAETLDQSARRILG